MSICKICPNCDARLDHGERCDCEQIKHTQYEASVNNCMELEKGILKRAVIIVGEQ